MSRHHMIEIKLTVVVPEDHPGFEDPEWVADAAWGALSNEYGLTTTYSVERVEQTESD